MKTKVMVVDDSAFMRKVISDMINASDSCEVMETARNGKDALEKLKTCKPDVITMDVEMPIMNGLDALQAIMDLHSIPVIMLSSITKEGADATIKALNYGAVDFVTKPTNIFKVSSEHIEKALIEKIEVAARVKITNKRPIRKKDIVPVARSYKVSGEKGRVTHLVAIGTSTGGPKALQSVIPRFPRNVNAGILVVQHMPPGFTKSLAERLDSISEITVKEAENGDIIEAGTAYIAPGNLHLKVTRRGSNYQIILEDSDPVSGHRPSVDALYYSLLDLGTRDIISVIMTGMGADGAKGLKALKDAKTYAIAQDEASCVVYGMPKSAVKLGAVDKVVSLESITDEIMKAMEV